MAPGWFTARAGEVPAGDAWLGAAERRVLAGLRVEKRRADWRLGRWTAKQALAAACRGSDERLEVLAAPDGAPEAWLDGARLTVSLSLSHRGDQALAVVDDAPAVVGCDLELIEPRSAAFVREWFPPAEQALLARCEPDERPLLANLLWAAREAAAKVRREGLRLAVRRARVELGRGAWAADLPRAGADAEPEPAPADWRPLRVLWHDAAPTSGWWRAEPGWVMAIAGTPAPQPPVRLRAGGAAGGDEPEHRAAARAGGAHAPAPR